MQESAVEQRLAVLLQADHRVELGAGLVQQHVEQEVDIGRRHFHVDQEVGTVGREQQRQLDRVHQQRIDVEPPVPVVLERQRERPPLRAVHHPADRVGGPVAVEQRRQHLDLMVGLANERSRRALAEGGQDIDEVAAEIGEAHLELEVEDDVHQRVAQPVLQRVVAAIGRRIRFDVLGGHGGPHEDEAVVEVGAVQDLAGDRVEECLGALRLLVVDEHADVVQLDALPECIGAAALEPGRAELVPDALDRLEHAAVVVVDAVARQVAQRQKIAGFEMAFGRARAVAKQCVMAIEALAQRLGDRVGRLVGDGGTHGRRDGGNGAGGHGDASVSGGNRPGRLGTERPAGSRPPPVPGSGTPRSASERTIRTARRTRRCDGCAIRCS